jgi:hypothetical protein
MAGEGMTGGSIRCHIEAHHNKMSGTRVIMPFE